MVCRECVPWNAPLVMREQTIVPGTVAALRFEQWMIYRLHVEQHQSADQWAGELEPVSLALRLNPLLTLDQPLPKAA